MMFGMTKIKDGALKDLEFKVAQIQRRLSHNFIKENAEEIVSLVTKVSEGDLYEELIWMHGHIEYLFRHPEACLEDLKREVKEKNEEDDDV